MKMTAYPTIRPDPRIRELLPANYETDDVGEMAIPSYFHWNPAVRWIITKRLNTIIGVSSFNSSDSVLDFGTGTGILLPALSSLVKSVVATDLRPEVAESWARINQLENVKVIGLPEFQRLGAGCFSKIVAADVLEHVDRLEELIARFRSLLQPGGRVIISGPTESEFYKLCRKIAGFRKHFHVRSISDIEHSFKTGNFRLKQKYRLPQWLPLKLFEILLFEAA